jgi:hypothetical protein
VQQWRFVIDLFEKGVLRRIVLDEDESESESGSGEESSSEDDEG